MIRKKRRHDHTHESHELFWLYLQHKETLNELKKINSKLRKIMGKIEDLNAKVDEMQSSIDLKQEQIAAAIAAFEQQIADLQALVNAGSAATPEQLQAVIDKLDAAKIDLQSTPTA